MKKILVAIAIGLLIIVVAGCGSVSPEVKPTAVALNTATNTPALTPLVSAPSPTLTVENQIKNEPTATPLPETPTPLAIADNMVEISAGSFIMGSDKGDAEDAPAHQVELPSFQLDRFEVTNTEFAKFVEATGYKTFAEQKGYANWRNNATAGKENHPVVSVTWDDAMAYCTWLKKRLPSEAEWEKAARSNDGRIYPWGNDWNPANANVKATNQRTTMAVGSFAAGFSSYGVADLTGNVWEWTADWYKPYSGNTAKDAYYGEKFRVTRGGGWFDEQPQATTFNRNAAAPEKTANDDLGFRCAR